MEKITKKEFRNLLENKQNCLVQAFYQKKSMIEFLDGKLPTAHCGRTVVPEEISEPQNAYVPIRLNFQMILLSISTRTEIKAIFV